MMYTFKEKVTDRFTRFFADSSSSSSSSPSQARPYSEGEKTFSSYFSYINPSAGFDRSISNKHQNDLKSIQEHPALYRTANSVALDESLEDCAKSSPVCDKKVTTITQDDYVDPASGRSTSGSEVFEEATNRHSPRKTFPCLMDESVFISTDLYEFLLSSLPNIVKGCQWMLLYSTLKHGISLRTLIRKSADLSGPCLLARCCVWWAARLPLEAYSEEKISRANRYYHLCMDDLLAFGGGGNFALCLDGDLLSGTSGPCQTFGNLCLAHNEEFELKNVELWGFTHASRYLT
ncbi:hypothetical protein F2P56_027610 [Juglans regia]|uniref:Oxidation resistance protein 1-like isoform X2 n=2 Tax=Juglans regia TaxID=51240 RepID=A0A2I4DKU9_JUGRE|nr:oxidation resistance protein 1-like isoform X2 [Juglans regia]KAF5452635.1 hypothetical protein F2P56_027610 [Juglans regia]